MSITQHDLDVHRETEEKILAAAEEVYREAYRLDPDGFKKILVERGWFEIDDDDICVVYDEYWSYGGHERYTDRFPVSWLLDDSWKQDVIAHRDARMKVARRAESRRQQELERKEREELARLLDKYGI